MIKVDKLAEKVFGALKGNGYSLILYTIEGTETVDPSVARRFYVSNPPIMVTIDEDNEELVLTMSESASYEETEKLQKYLKKLANEFLINYTVRNYGKSIQPRDFSYQAKRIKEHSMDINESKLSQMFGSSKTSYQTLEDVKILVRHKKAVSEESRGARTRHIQSIFIERAGERFKFPHKHLGAARAMARHMSYGGEMHDTIGEHIVSSTQKFLDLKEFARYASKNNLVNEDTSDIIALVKESSSQLKRTLEQLAGANSYFRIKEKIESESNDAIEEDYDAELKDMFTVKKFDEKFETILPIVQSLVNERNSYNNRIEEAANSSIVVSADPIMTGLKFESEMAKLGYYLSEMSKGISENTELASFLAKAGRKMHMGESLNEFEKEVVQKSLLNMVSEDNYNTEDAKIEEIRECAELEKKLNFYTQIF